MCLPVLLSVHPQHEWPVVYSTSVTGSREVRAPWPERGRRPWALDRRLGPCPQGGGAEVLGMASGSWAGGRFYSPILSLGTFTEGILGPPHPHYEADP